MAEILIKASDNVNPDPELDKFCYKRGYVVCVMPDGHPWGKKECLPDFVVLKVPNMTVENTLQYLQEKLENPQTINQKAIGRRVKKLNVDSTLLPLAKRNTIKNTGVVTLTKAQTLAIVQSI